MERELDSAANGPATEPYHIVVARSVTEVEAIRSAWENAPVDVLDAQIDYFLTVVQTAKNVMCPYVVLVQRPGRSDLIAVARIERLDRSLSLGYRRIANLNSRAVVVAFGGIIGVEGSEDEETLLSHLFRPLETGEADLLLLRQLDVTGSLLRTVIRKTSWLRRSHAQRPTRRWTVEVPESLDQFLSMRSRKTRQKLRTWDRRFADTWSGRVRIRCFKDVKDLFELRHDLEQVASKTYQRGLGVAFSGTPVELALMRLGLTKGWFHAWVLYLAEAPVAFWMGMAYRGNFSTDTPGFDPAFAEYSVGRYAMFRMVEDLCSDENVSQLDFGSGDAEYKEAFGHCDREEIDVVLAAPHLWPVMANLLTDIFVGINNLGRLISQRTTVGRRMKRSWRSRIAPKAKVEE